MSVSTNQITHSVVQNYITSDFAQAELERKVKMLRSICALMLGVHAAAIVSAIGLGILSGTFNFLSSASIIAGIIIYTFAYRIAYTRYFEMASWLAVGGLIVVATFTCWQSSTASPIVIVLLLPIALAIALLNVREVIVVTGICLLLSLAFYLSQNFFNLYNPVVAPTKQLQGLSGIITIILIMPTLVALLVLPVRSQLRVMQAQNKKLQVALNEIQTRQQTGQQVSQQVLSLAAELSTTASQQAAGTQEQVAAVSQVSTSLEELSESAGQIAASAAAASYAANQTVTIATEVRDASEIAQSVVHQGNEAVEQAVGSVARVRNRIELLGQRLLHLTEQTRQVSTIIDIIDEIADETHLLALNASIEAAGSINAGDTTSSSSRGERFGIIAQEVKSLSDRSREATEEVREAIVEMQGAVAAAVLVAEEGKKETAAALSRSEIAGLVIEKLSQVISSSSDRANQILRAVEEVNLRCDEISLATGQQRTANQQILMTMRNVVEVSQESAGFVSQLSQTAYRVNDQMSELNRVLERTSAITPATRLAPALA